MFAAGCFWSKEYFFNQAPGVIATRVGYTGGHTEHPTYNQVLTKTTGHAEAVEITFDPKQTSFEELIKLFFEIHDPTIDRTDKGGQYRSAIFYQNQEQQAIAENLIAALREKGFDIATTLEPAGIFWQAEDRHQKYCDTHGIKPTKNKAFFFFSRKKKKKGKINFLVFGSPAFFFFFLKKNKLKKKNFFWLFFF
ncbi:MAG: peptide-methionine (S)-S-oxide reductase MsrA [Saprospiraceae bacterium]|nr:peptide-methionine (S)-S-oxide reductase MsrA [Saprospiraceae bacterium]